MTNDLGDRARARLLGRLLPHEEKAGTERAASSSFEDLSSKDSTEDLTLPSVIAGEASDPMLAKKRELWEQQLAIFSQEALLGQLNAESLASLQAWYRRIQEEYFEDELQELAQKETHLKLLQQKLEAFQAQLFEEPSLEDITQLIAAVDQAYPQEKPPEFGVSYRTLLQFREHKRQAAKLEQELAEQERAEEAMESLLLEWMIPLEDQIQEAQFKQRLNSLFASSGSIFAPALSLLLDIVAREPELESVILEILQKVSAKASASQERFQDPSKIREDVLAWMQERSRRVEALRLKYHELFIARIKVSELFRYLEDAEIANAIQRDHFSAEQDLLEMRRRQLLKAMEEARAMYALTEHPDLSKFQAYDQAKAVNANLGTLCAAVNAVISEIQKKKGRQSRSETLVFEKLQLYCGRGRYFQDIAKLANDFHNFSLECQGRAEHAVSLPEVVRMAEAYSPLGEACDALIPVVKRARHVCSLKYEDRKSAAKLQQTQELEWTKLCEQAQPVKTQDLDSLALTHGHPPLSEKRANFLTKLKEQAEFAKEDLHESAAILPAVTPKVVVCEAISTSPETLQIAFGELRNALYKTHAWISPVGGSFEFIEMAFKLAKQDGKLRGILLEAWNKEADLPKVTGLDALEKLYLLAKNPESLEASARSVKLEAFLPVTAWKGEKITHYTFLGGFVGNFEEADFSGMDLRGVDLRQASLRGANFKGTLMDHRTQLPKILEGVDLSSVSFSNLSAEQPLDLSYRLFDGASVLPKNLKGFCLNEAVFRGMRFHGTEGLQAKQARFEQCVFTGVCADWHLTGAEFQRARFEENFQGSAWEVKEAQFSGNTVVNGIFTNGSRLSGCQFDRLTTERKPGYAFPQSDAFFEENNRVFACSPEHQRLFSGTPFVKMHFDEVTLAQVFTRLSAQDQSDPEKEVYLKTTIARLSARDLETLCSHLEIHYPALVPEARQRLKELHFQELAAQAAPVSAWRQHQVARIYAALDPVAAQAGLEAKALPSTLSQMQLRNAYSVILLSLPAEPELSEAWCQELYETHHQPLLLKQADRLVFYGYSQPKGRWSAFVLGTYDQAVLNGLAFEAEGQPHQVEAQALPESILTEIVEHQAHVLPALRSAEKEADLLSLASQSCLMDEHAFNKTLLENALGKLAPAQQNVYAAKWRYQYAVADQCQAMLTDAMLKVAVQDPNCFTKLEGSPTAEIWLAQAILMKQGVKTQNRSIYLMQAAFEQDWGALIGVLGATLTEFAQEGHLDPSSMIPEFQGQALYFVEMQDAVVNIRINPNLSAEEIVAGVNQLPLMLRQHIGPEFLIALNKMSGDSFTWTNHQLIWQRFQKPQMKVALENLVKLAEVAFEKEAKLQALEERLAQVLSIASAAYMTEQGRQGIPQALIKQVPDNLVLKERWIQTRADLPSAISIADMQNLLDASDLSGRFKECLVQALMNLSQADEQAPLYDPEAKRLIVSEEDQAFMNARQIWEGAIAVSPHNILRSEQRAEKLARSLLALESVTLSQDRPEDAVQVGSLSDLLGEP